MTGTADEIALYSLVVLLMTGGYLSLYFHPSTDVVYDGGYAPLRGQLVSRTFESTVHLSFEVRGGLLVRQAHHWAALVFVAAVFAHLLRVFFTGAFRKPRELNWVLGLLLLVLAMFAGLTGYDLPDDLMSGTGLQWSAARCCRSRSSVPTCRSSSDRTGGPRRRGLVPGRMGTGPLA